MIRINGNDCRLYGAVNPETSEILQFRLFPVSTKQTTRRFLAEFY
jgi:transposase-like protein